MALIKCNECGNEYSSNANECPKCGNPTGGKKSNTNNQTVSGLISSLLGLVIIGGIIYFIVGVVMKSNVDGSKYDTKKTYHVGDTLDCPDFDVTIDKVQIKKKGTRIDSYSKIADPEWIGVTLTIKNKSKDTKTFYGSKVDLVNSSGEVLEHDFMTYKIWGVELLDSPELISGGSKTGYIQYTNTEADNSKLVLKVDCDTGLFDDKVVYKVDVSQK
jgi:hypothetical protein